MPSMRKCDQKLAGCGATWPRWCDCLSVQLSGERRRTGHGGIQDLDPVLWNTRKSLGLTLLVQEREETLTPLGQGQLTCQDQLPLPSLALHSESAPPVTFSQTRSPMTQSFDRTLGQ